MTAVESELARVFEKDDGENTIQPADPGNIEKDIEKMMLRLKSGKIMIITP
jgi:hypothetical protein